MRLRTGRGRQKPLREVRGRDAPAPGMERGTFFVRGLTSPGLFGFAEAQRVAVALADLDVFLAVLVAEP